MALLKLSDECRENTDKRASLNKKYETKDPGFFVYGFPAHLYCVVWKSHLIYRCFSGVLVKILREKPNAKQNLSRASLAGGGAGRAQNQRNKCRKRGFWEQTRDFHSMFSPLLFSEW